MRRPRPALLFIAITLVAFGPLLSACAAPPAPPSTEALAGKSLPEVVEIYMADLPGASPKLFLSSEVYDRQGNLIGEFWDEGHRIWVPIDRISSTLRQALISVEDKSFYTNPGVDWAGIARAVIDNSQSQDPYSGASTITQQLARNIVYPYEKRVERSLDRKLGETLVAQDLTARFTKDQILEMYLNVVYFGHLAYGVEAAARTYFGKTADDLTLPEAALLAALPQGPAELDPFVADNRLRVKERQGIVLALMARSGFITRQQAEAAYRQPLKYQAMQIPQVAPYFMEYVRQDIEGRYNGAPIGRLGLAITATIDLRLQKLGEDIVRKQVEASRARYNLNNAAMVALKPGSGEILAMVGGVDYYAKVHGAQVNVAISQRQPGSAIKPVLYTMAFMRGLNPATVIWDIPTEFALNEGGRGPFYRPTNYDFRFHGPVRIRQALSNSYNVPAVKVLYQMGVPEMVDMAHAMGVRGLDRPANEYGLSLTLGGGEVTLLSLTNAYTTIANGGRLVPVTSIISITDSSGRVIDGHKPSRQVADPRAAYMVTSILSDNEARIPAFGANNPLKLSRPAAAKTGTTSDWRDNLTVGFTPYLAVGVWAGNTDGRPMRNTTGLTGAAPIWHEFFETVFSKPELDAAVRSANEPLDFQRPDGLLDVPICELSSWHGGTTCPKTRTELVMDPQRPVSLEVAASQPVTPTNVTQRVYVPSLVSAIDGGSAPAAEQAPVKVADPGWAVVQISRSAGTACVVEQGGAAVGVIRVPADPQEAARVRRWAAAAGIAAEPPACTGGRTRDVYTAPPTTQTSGAARTAGATAMIDSPAAGSVVRGPVTVSGSAQFRPGDISFYKVEWGYGANPSSWVTMGSGHNEPVGSGWLETWHAESLPPGTYALRLVLVKPDGNYLSTPPVAVTVTN